MEEGFFVFGSCCNHIDAVKGVGLQDSPILAAENLSMSTTKAENLQKEYLRIKKLSEFDLDLYELREQFKSLMELAGHIAGTEVSVVNLIDNYSQWTLSAVEEDPKRIAKENSICAYTIRSHSFMEVHRLDLDERFKDKPYVVGEEAYRYYLGMPLTLSSGENVGSLCMLDTQQQQIGEDKKLALAVIAREIVHKLEHRRKLNETLYTLSETVRIKNQVAHDVRGPVHGIAGLAESVEDEDLSADEMREYFTLIKNSGKGIIDLTDEILNSGRDQEMQASRKINMADLQERLLQLYDLPAKSKNLDFKVFVNREKDQLKFSRRRVLSIFGNLISNSIKFTPAGGLIEVHMDFVNTETGKQLEVMVQDNGKGMSSKALENYFEDVSELSSGTGGEKGFGLGLKLVNELVHELGGSMKIASEINKGTKISILIPVL